MEVFLYLLILSLMTIAKGSDDTCCPDAWLPYKGSCYLFHDEEKMDWNEAQQYCKNKAKTSGPVALVAIETANENLFLTYYVRKLYNQDSNHRNTTIFWLGASDGDIEGIWKWIDKDEELTYTAWDKDTLSQPNKSPDNHEDCLALNGAYDFKWHDGICRERVGFPICEKKGTSSGTGSMIIG